MTDRNRVAPTGEITAAPGRGAWLGNRGCLHQGRDIVRAWRNRAWVTCSLEFRGRWSPQWRPGRYTQLFFLDEAIALAAGHRPCAECRRGDFDAFRAAWAIGHGGALPYAKGIDAALHRERLTDRNGRRVLTPVGWEEVPGGAFVVLEEGPAVVAGGQLTLVDVAKNRYGARLARPGGSHAQVLTPPSIVAVLRAGYAVQIDDAATATRDDG